MGVDPTAWDGRHAALHGQLVRGREPHASLLIDTNIAKGHAVSISLVGLGLLDQTRGAIQERAVYTLFPEVRRFNNVGIRGDERVGRHDGKPPARGRAPVQAWMLTGIGTPLPLCLPSFPVRGPQLGCHRREGACRQPSGMPDDRDGLCGPLGMPSLPALPPLSQRTYQMLLAHVAHIVSLWYNNASWEERPVGKGRSLQKVRQGCRKMRGHRQNCLLRQAWCSLKWDLHALRPRSQTVCAMCTGQEVLMRDKRMPLRGTRDRCPGPGT